MKIDPKLVEQWREGWHPAHGYTALTEYIAQRAADYALEQAAKVCDDRESEFGSYYTKGAHQVCAEAIRALKEQK